MVCRDLPYYADLQNFADFKPVFQSEPPHGKTNKMAFAPSEDSDQTDQNLRCPHEESLGP